MSLVPIEESDWVLEEDLPEGVAFITSYNEVVGVAFEEGLELTAEEEEIVDKALLQRGLPPLSTMPAS